MKTASVIVKLTKDQHVHKHNVTPIEVLLLAAMHSPKSGGDPIEVVRGTEKEVKDLTEDQIISGLRLKYVPAYMNMLKDVRALPTTFDDAILKGKGITMPGAMSSTAPAAAVISTTKVTT